MRTVNVENKRLKVTYRTNSEMRTKAGYAGKLFNQGLSCDVYNVEDDKHIALVLNSVNADIKESTTVITIDEYEQIADLYEPTAGGKYHTALLEKCGAENHLKLS